jgi:PP-loop superfamily ATP-utilizing enzyme
MLTNGAVDNLTTRSIAAARCGAPVWTCPLWGDRNSGAVRLNISANSEISGDPRVVISVAGSDLVEEAADHRQELLGPLEHDRVTGPRSGKQFEAGTRDCIRDHLPLRRRRDQILLASDHERGGCDVAESIERVVGQIGVKLFDDGRDPVTRCFHCKSNLYNTIASFTDTHIVSGTNTDDLGDFRPGLAAASALDVHHPYVEAGIDKDGVRRIARTFGLDDLAELPAAPCLSSRIETGLPIESSVLSLVHEVERELTNTIAPKAVRCRVRAGRVVVEIDEAMLAGLDAFEQQRIIGDVAQRWRHRGRPSRVELAPYRRGSSFVHQIQQEVTLDRSH